MSKEKIRKALEGRFESFPDLAFDRKGYEIGSSKEVLFNYNQTAIRVLERFDVQKLDDRACKKIEFTKPV